MIGDVEHAAIIPEGEIAGLPLVPIDEIGVAAMGVNFIQHCRALVVGHAIDAVGELRVHENRFSAGFGMGPQDWMKCL